MPVRKIVRIDESKCNGCGQCIIGCAEGALQLIEGKARLVRDDYCDGLGACIGTCPCGAITIEDREAVEFDEEAVKRHLTSGASPTHTPAEAAGAIDPCRLEVRASAPTEPYRVAPGGCPGLAIWQFESEAEAKAPAASSTDSRAGDDPHRAPQACSVSRSELHHWPIQLALVPPSAPFLRQTDLLLAADCAPVAVPDFQGRFLRGHAVVLACPKLDDKDAYVAKLSAMLQQADLRSLTILHMRVPCCSGLNRIVQSALRLSEVCLPVREVTVAVDGRVVDDRAWPDAQSAVAHGPQSLRVL